jgi:lantibiotic modifying enzyme
MKEAEIYNNNNHHDQTPSENEPMPLIWQWHEKHYLGAAHGVVGILHTLLQLSQQDLDLVEKNVSTTKVNVLQLIKDTINSVMKNFSFESGNLQSSVSSEKDRLVHWCHGAPGLCLLLLRASKRLQYIDEQSANKYLQMASSIAESVVYPRGLLKKGTGLCHGISGNGYVLLQLSQAYRNIDPTKELEWRNRAIQFAAFAVRNLNSLKGIPDRPYS